MSQRSNVAVYFKKLTPSAKHPQYQTSGAACFDLHSDRDIGDVVGSCIVPTGLAIEIPDGYTLLIFSRSGHGFKNDVRLANCVGVIDSDFRGEICIKLTADRPGNPLRVMAGDRIAQGMLLPMPFALFIESDTLSSTVRGDGGFGSTGA